MKHLLMFLLLILPVLSHAEYLLPPLVSVVSSSDGRYLVRYDLNIKVYSCTDDEKEYRLISEIEPLWHGSVQKALISIDGNSIVTFESPRSPSVPILEEIVCVYSKDGKTLHRWRLQEILSKNDISKLVRFTHASIWWHHEVAFGLRSGDVIFTGPTNGPDPNVGRYKYALNLSTLVWRKMAE